MDTMMCLFSFLIESPFPFPNPSPSAVVVSTTIGDLISTGTIVKLVLSLFGGLISNPIVGGPVLIAFIGLLFASWSYIKAQYRAWQVRQAQQATAQGEQDFIQNQVVINQDNTNKDNEGRNQLDNLP